MPFKLYGYKDEGLPSEEVVPAELAEITLVAGPAELRQIASFLLHAAEGMEAKGKTWGHEHLSDRMPEFRSSPHFVVYNPEVGE
ncbi:hypothetical protein [Pseudomonas sp.]|uniref:Imm32 family immunity protein n=1 Tax=Pseudomonas sp. TaxID=306 RepID=UPI0027358107|nr:hypothetical protein [Pseudomonas sp.]MDP2748094.1 hypothetical protein [Pseudomonas sp.]